MIWLQVAATLARELVRSCTVPARLLCYLPRRRRWRRAAREALDAASRRAPGEGLDGLTSFLDRGGGVTAAASAAPPVV